MRPRAGIRKLFAVSLAASLVFAIFFSVVRPLYMRWLVFQVLTLLQPPWPIGIALVASLMLSLWWRGAQFPFGPPGNRRRYRINSPRSAGEIV